MCVRACVCVFFDDVILVLECVQICVVICLMPVVQSWQS